MKFFCITKLNQKITRDLLKKSAEEKNIEFINIDCDSFDIENPNYNNQEGIFYRVASGGLAKNIELFLLENNNFTTFYNNKEAAYFSSNDIALQKFHKFPMPKTITFLIDNYDFLEKAVNYVGGFPVILKVTGLSHGAGVMKINTMETLVSVVGFMKKNKVESIVIREYIDSYRHARLIVIGSQVVSSIEYIVPEKDFRTNVGTPQVKPENFSEEFEKIAVGAVNSLKLEFGGVDILIGKDGKPYLAEVNFPCYFPRNQIATKNDISGMMINYLVEKYNKENGKGN